MRTEAAATAARAANNSTMNKKASRIRFKDEKRRTRSNVKYNNISNMVTGERQIDSKVRLVLPRKVTLKEIPDGVGVVRDPSRKHATFKATTRDKEVELQQPANGPSPSCTQFDPKYKNVRPQSPRYVEY